MQNNLSPSVKGVFKIMANAIINGQNNVNEQNAANAATATPAPVAEQKEQQTAQTSRRRRSTTPPMWRVMTQARPFSMSN